MPDPAGDAPDTVTQLAPVVIGRPVRRARPEPDRGQAAAFVIPQRSEAAAGESWPDKDLKPATGFASPQIPLALRDSPL